jgi:hypothetical protein
MPSVVDSRISMGYLRSKRRAPPVAAGAISPPGLAGDRFKCCFHRVAIKVF